MRALEASERPVSRRRSAKSNSARSEAMNSRNDMEDRHHGTRRVDAVDKYSNSRRMLAINVTMWPSAPRRRQFDPAQYRHRCA